MSHDKKDCHPGCGFYKEPENMTPQRSDGQEEKGRYRVVRYYHNFFAHYAYRLERRARFLCWSWWEVVSDDGLGINGASWCNHYGCEIVEAEAKGLLSEQKGGEKGGTNT